MGRCVTIVTPGGMRLRMFDRQRPGYSELSPEETSAKIAPTVTSIEGIVAVVVERNGFARI